MLRLLRAHAAGAGALGHQRCRDLLVHFCEVHFWLAILQSRPACGRGSGSASMLQSAAVQRAAGVGPSGAPRHARPARWLHHVCKAAGGGQEGAEDASLPQVPKQRRRRKGKEPKEEPFSLDSLNPVSSE